MRRSRRLTFGAIGVAAFTLGVILGGCGATPTTTAGRRTAASTVTVAATDTPLPTATTSPDTVEAPGCPPVVLGPVAPQYGTVDGLNVSIPQRWTSLDFPDELMPNGEPAAPYQVPLTAREAQNVGAFHPNPPVNPSLATGYALQVCNQTDAAHTVTSLVVAIASFTPSSGPVTVWHLCQDGPYDAATQQTTPGCGGAFGGVDLLAATLPRDTTGASAAAVANPQYHSSGPNPPIAIDPNTSIVFLIAVNGLTSQGTYALGFSLSIDGAPPATLTPSDGPFLIAPAAIVWTGTACQTPGMQAQIPAASQDTYYVCPPAS
jgi:hypothetical protein